MNDIPNAQALADAWSEIGALKQVIRDLKVACEMAQAEAVTLEARLHEPFAGHQRVIKEKCGEALEGVKKINLET